jgi:YHS domain-containing protein
MEPIEKQQVIKTVCGGILTEPEKYPSVVLKGECLYFCTHACLRGFEQNPQAFWMGKWNIPLKRMCKSFFWVIKKIRRARNARLLLNPRTGILSKSIPLQKHLSI